MEISPYLTKHHPKAPAKRSSILKNNIQVGSIYREAMRRIHSFGSSLREILQISLLFGWMAGQAPAQWLDSLMKMVLVRLSKWPRGCLRQKLGIGVGIEGRICFILIRYASFQFVLLHIAVLWPHLSGGISRGIEILRYSVNWRIYIHTIAWLFHTWNCVCLYWSNIAILIMNAPHSAFDTNIYICSRTKLAFHMIHRPIAPSICSLQIYILLSRPFQIHNLQIRFWMEHSALWMWTIRPIPLR